MILRRLWLAIAGGRSTSINIFVWQYLLGISRGLIMQIICQISLLLSPGTPAFVVLGARGSSVVERPNSLLFFYVFVLYWTWQVQTATVTWNNTLYNAYVNIQRLRVLAYAFGKSENYPSRNLWDPLSEHVIKLAGRWQSLSQRTGGSYGILARFLKQRPLRKGRDCSQLYRLAWLLTK